MGNLFSICENKDTSKEMKNEKSSISSRSNSNTTKHKFQQPIIQNNDIMDIYYRSNQIESSII